jgi:hypothetical protein
VTGTRVQLFPDVVDLSLVLTASGLGALIATFVAAALGFAPERLVRLVTCGTLLGGAVGIGILIGFLLGVLS